MSAKADLVADLPDTVLRRMRDVMVPKTEEDFLRQLYQQLDTLLQKLEDRREHYQEAAETALTTVLADLLDVAGYLATPDTLAGGHCDLVVACREAAFGWRGEAKIHGSYPHLSEGMLQLLTRYSTGDHCAAGLVVFVRGQNCKQVRDRWRSHLKKDGERLNLEAIDDDTYSPMSNQRDLRFISSHRHAGSGLVVRVRTMTVPMHWNPLDRSGRDE